MRGNRPLQDHTKNIRIVIHLHKTALAFILRQLCRPVLLVKRQANRGSGTRLAADVYGNLIDLANADRDKTPDTSALAKSQDFSFDTLQNPLSDISAIEQARVAFRRHGTSPKERAAV